MMWAPTPVTAPATALTATGTPVTAPAAPSSAPAAQTPLVSDGVSKDLSGLEVHSIEESSEAPRMFGTPVYYRPSIFGQNRPRRRWRWRVMRWAAAIFVVLAIVFIRAARGGGVHQLLPAARRTGPHTAGRAATAAIARDEHARA